jgi:hypothetical protein
MAALSVQDQYFSRLKISLEAKSSGRILLWRFQRDQRRAHEFDIRFKQVPPVILHWASGDKRPVQELVFSQNALSTESFKNQIQLPTDSLPAGKLREGGKECVRR